MLEVARERRSIRASGGVARQFNALVIVQNLFAIGEMEIIPRITEPRLFASTISDVIQVYGF
jgi:hypothetical protein